MSASVRRSKPAPAPQVVDLPGPPLVRKLLVLLGSLYLAAMFAEGAGGSLNKTLYRPLLFFCQIAALFPQAATHTIEYRAEGYSCNARVIELDMRPLFPIHADDKENRFDRAMYFYRQDRTVMQALEAYVMREHNRSDPDKIGGVIFLSLRVPLPRQGTDFARYQRRPIADHPPEERKVWYVTPHETVLRRCKEGDL
jgi:hypothetical protein